MKFNRSLQFGTVIIGALVLCVLGVFLLRNGSHKKAPDPLELRYKWLLEPVAKRFPPADQALEIPGFRVAGVHYWQGNWNFNFWPNLKVHEIDDDFRRIKEHGFNTIILSISWGYFQTKAFPPTYNDRAFEKLIRLIDAAAQHDLYVILRVGSHDELPEGIRGQPFLVPYLLVDDRELPAFCDLFRETARRLADWDNLLFLFFSWEDLWGHVFVSQQDHEYRMNFMKEADAFRRHLSRRPPSDWNQRWQTNYQSLEEIPFPAYGSPAYGDFFRFADQRLVDVILPAVAAAAREGSPGVQLSFEVRVDKEPIWSSSEPDWIDHHRTWNLTPGYQVVSAYFNPYWGDAVTGGFVSADKAVSRLDFLLAAMGEYIIDKPIFFDQLNFTDSTPWLQPYSPTLEGEEEIARFLEQSLDTLWERSLGYAIWALRAFEVNSLYNSSFEDGLSAWQVPDPALVRIEDDTGRLERFVVLEPAGLIRQESRVRTYSKPFDLRLMARSQTGGRLAVRFDAAEASGWQTVDLTELFPRADWEEYQLRLPTAKEYRLTLESTGTGAVEVDNLSLFQYVQMSSVLDRKGEIIGRRSEILTRSNRSWRNAGGKIGLDSPSSWSQEELVRAGHAYEDGWLPREAIVPLLIPWFNSALELEFYLPDNEPAAAGSSVQVELGSRSLGDHVLKAGHNRLYLPLEESLHPRRWMLRLTFGRELRPRDHDPQSEDERSLGALPIVIRAVRHGPEDQHWSTEVSVTESARHVEALVQVVGRGGSPLKHTLVLGHGGAFVAGAETDANGRAALKLDVERQEGRSTPIFIELLDPRARIASVEIR